MKNNKNLKQSPAYKKKQMGQAIVLIAVILILIACFALISQINKSLGNLTEGEVRECSYVKESISKDGFSDSIYLVKIAYTDTEGKNNIASTYVSKTERTAPYKTGDKVKIHYKDSNKSKAYIYYSNWYFVPVILALAGSVLLIWGLKLYKAAKIKLKEEKQGRIEQRKQELEKDWRRGMNFDLNP